MADSDNGIVRLPSSKSVDQTLQDLLALLTEKGVKVFAVVDHSGEAEKAGLTMPPTKLVIFGNPKAGTPIMQAAPSAAIDLPLKILIAQDGEGQVWLSYNRPEYLAARHGLELAQVAGLQIIGHLTEMAAQ